MPANNRPQVYTEFVRIRIRPEHMEMLQALANTKNSTISRECRTAIEQYLQNVNKVAVPILMEHYLK